MGELEQWENIGLAYPSFTRILVINKEIVGYYFYVFLKEEYVDELKNGTLSDEDITLDKIELPDLPGKYSCYFMDIAIIQDRRWLNVGGSLTSTIQLLLRDFANQLERLAKNNHVFISDLYTHAFTNDGKRWCKRLGMKKTDENPTRTNNIFYLKLFPFPQKGFVVDNYPQLKELYDDYWGKRDV